MTATLLLALTATADGQPAALLPGPESGHATLLADLAATAAEHGPVTVLTRTGWAPAVRTALAAHPAAGEAAVTVVEVADAAAALRWWAIAHADQPGPLALVHAHLLSDEVGLTSLLDAAGGSLVLAEEIGAVDTPPPGHRPGASWLRATRGRVVGVSSAGHALAGPTHRAVGAVRLAGDAVTAALDAVPVLAAAVDETVLPDDPDLVAWLLVAAVRAGAVVRLGLVPRRGVAALVTTPAQARELARHLTALDLDAVRLAETVKREDGFFTTYFVSSYSPRLVRVAARLGLSPDAVTIISMLLGVGAALGFARGQGPAMLAGALLLQAAFTLDCVDGQLARYTRRFSLRGAWLDAIFDRGKEVVVLAGLAVGGVRTGVGDPVWLLAGAALALQTVRHTLDLGYQAQQAADVDTAVRRALLDPGDAGPGFWEVAPAVTASAATVPEVPAVPATPAGARGLARRVIVALRRAEEVAVLKWLKRIVVLPIGERFALISVLAVLSGPVLVFQVLLVWGSLAAAYTFTGRLVRSVA